MHLNDYQNAARKTAIYPDHGKSLIYPALGLAEEAGEVVGHVKRILRDDGGHLTDKRTTDIVMELGDVLWYVAMIADELEVPLSEIAHLNLSKLQHRRETNKLHGKGSDR